MLTLCRASLNETLVWDLIAGQLKSAPTLLVPRAYAKAAASGSCFVVSGGMCVLRSLVACIIQSCAKEIFALRLLSGF